MSEEDKKFLIDKAVWTEADFENMGWQDVNIHGLSIENSSNNWTGNLLLDIDYIFKWVDPESPDPHFSFWVAPCTLKFIEAFNLIIQFDSENFASDSIEIADIHLIRTNEIHENSILFEWRIELQLGEVSLKSKGFIQTVRQKPIHTEEQVLSLEQRGGVSFSEVPFKIN